MNLVLSIPSGAESGIAAKNTRKEINSHEKTPRLSFRRLRLVDLA
jgi:hypothetical protein